MSNEFTIKQKLPSLNQVILANRTNRYAGAKLKRETEEMIGASIRSALAEKTLYKPNKAVIVEIDYYERTKRRDCDNIIAGGTKLILDALVREGVLINDSRKYVKQMHCNVVDGKEDFVVVRLIEP